MALEYAVVVPEISNTAKPFVELVQYLFTVPGVKCFLSRNICQDHFLAARGKWEAYMTTPLSGTFNKMFRHYVCIVIMGNCRGNKRKDDLDTDKENCDCPLPKCFKPRGKEKV